VRGDAVGEWAASSRDERAGAVLMTIEVVVEYSYVL
jgi:hypothetical protein